MQVPPGSGPPIPPPVVTQQAQSSAVPQHYHYHPAVDTGLGPCPHCGSRNIMESRVTETDPLGCLICCLFIIPFFFGLSQRTVGVSRGCRNCGFAWKAL